MPAGNGPRQQYMVLFLGVDQVFNREPLLQSREQDRRQQHGDEAGCRKIAQQPECRLLCCHLQDCRCFHRICLNLFHRFFPNR